MKAFPTGDLGQISLAISGMNLLSCLLYWPVPLILRCIEYETYNLSTMPSALVVGSWMCTAGTYCIHERHVLMQTFASFIVSATAAGYGLVLSNPFFMSIGELLILAANSGESS